MNEYCLRSGLKEKWLWLLLFLGTAYFARPLFFQETFYFRDLYLHFYPQKLRWIELIRSGDLPLWDRYLHGGQPFLADINNMALYPSNLLYLILPLPFVFNFDIVLHILLGAAAMYLLARSLGFLPVSSLIAAGIFGFCGYRLSLTNLMNHLFASSYFPVLLLCWHLYLARGHRKWLIAAVLFGTAQIFAGAPEMAALTLLLLLGWSLFYPFRMSSGKRVIRWSFLCFFILGLSAIQLIPTVEMLMQSSRVSGGHFYSFTGWSLHPKRLPELLIPGFFGYTDRISGLDYWGSKIEDLGFPYILSIYLGITVVILAIAGIRANERFPRRARWFLGAAASAGLILSLGRYLPFSELVYRYAGVLAWMRYPVKFLAFSILPVALLAAAGAERLFSSDLKSVRAVLLLFWFCIAVSFCGMLAFQYADSWAGNFLRSYFVQSGETARMGLVSAFSHAALFGFLAALLIQYRMLRRYDWQFLAFALVLLMDLALAGSGVLHYAPTDFLTQEPNLVGTVRKEIGEGRLFRSWNPRDIVYQVPADQSIYIHRWNLETLNNYTVALYSIPVIFHEDFDRMAQKELMALSNEVHRLPWHERIPALSAGGVTLVLSADRIDDSDFPLVAAIRNRSNYPFYLYRNLKAALPASFVPEENGCSGGNVRSLKVQSRRASYEVTAPCRGTLELPTPFYRGWRAEIDGLAAPLTRSRQAFTALRLESGTHRIDLKYLPLSFLAGVAVSAMFAIALLLCLSRGIFKEKARIVE